MSSSPACLFIILALTAAHVLNASATTKETFTYDVSATLHEISLRKGKELATKATKNLRRMARKVSNSDGPCRWDTVTNACVVGYGAVTELFSESGNKQAQFFAQFTKCLASVDAEECAAASKCSWDTDSKTCRFLDFYTGNENSPCVVAADGVIQEAVAIETCTLHKTQLSCYKDPVCEWDDEDLSCDVAGFVFYIGVPLDQMLEASQAVIRHKTRELSLAFLEAFDLYVDDFKFEDILDWKIPETSCPSWSDPLVCTYADAIVATMPQSYYCGAKHSGFTGLLECATDPLCSLDPLSGTCRQTDKSFIPGYFQGMKNMVSTYVNPPLDKKILLQSFECVAIEKKEQCKSPCLWTKEKEGESDKEFCSLSGQWAAKIIAESGDKSDPVCKMEDLLAKSNCVDIDDQDACDADPHCSTLLSGDCWMSVNYQIKDVTTSDSTLKASYDKLEEACSSKKTEEICHAKA